MAHARIFWRKTRQKVKIFYIDYEDANGRRHREAAGPVKQVAELRLQDALLRAAKGELKLEPKPAIALSEIAPRYLEHKRSLEQRAVHSKATILRVLQAGLGDAALHEITPKAVDAYIAARRAGQVTLPSGRQRPVSMARVNRELAVLRNLLNKAEEWAYRVPEGRHPVKGKLGKESRGRTRFLTEAEAEALRAQCMNQRAHLKPIVQCALNTGMRAGEILGLTWDRVDFAKRQIILEDTKNREARYVPINEPLFYVLRRLEAGRAGPHVFGPRQGRGVASVRRAFEGAVKDAGLQDVTFHTLRHTAASWMVQRGVPLYQVGQVLGHKSLAMTQRYAHLAPEHLAAAVGVLTCGRGTYGAQSAVPEIPASVTPQN